ncbi:MAG: alpha-galactosidase, partial [Bacilli bacterium]
KWDYNRNISYIPYSSFNLDYIKGLYSLLRRVTAAYPDVLFENCASGGNRFDLGMLSFFPQSWMSDDTDSFQREFIQGGAIYGYPLSVMSNHVAAKTSNQLLRKTTLDTKFDVASFGVLGYELDLNDLFDKDLSVIKEQIKFYKKHRMTLQFGKIGIVSDYSENTNRSIQVFDDEKTIVGIYEAIAKPTSREGHLKALYLDDDQLYSYQTRTHSFPLQKFGSLVNYVSPVHLKEDGTLLSVLAKHVDMKGETDKGITSGRVFRSIGPVLSQEWSGVGYDERIRLMGDFGSRMYVIEKVKTDN